MRNGCFTRRIFLKRMQCVFRLFKDVFCTFSGNLLFFEIGNIVNNDSPGKRGSRSLLLLHHHCFNIPNMYYSKQMLLLPILFFTSNDLLLHSLLSLIVIIIIAMMPMALQTTIRRRIASWPWGLQQIP